MEATRPAIGISSCLLGEEVRYDGGHKRDTFITEHLARHFDFRPVCPEVAIGLGVPRPAIHLRQGENRVRVVDSKDPEVDHTDAMEDYARRQAGELRDISGYIFKAKSPSCGVWRVPVQQGQGPPDRGGRGVYADAFIRARPLLPVEEEGRLNDPVLRENFVERVFAFRRWQDLTAEGLTPDGLVRFHTIHKLTIMSHDDQAMRALGRLVSKAGSRSIEELAGEYITGFMDTMAKRATRKRHADVLMHLMGYLKSHLDGDDKQELLDVIHEYRRGEVPLIVPLTLIKHHFRRHPHPYATEQVYLNPHPRELMLRNTI
jgi:uncharacterized protein YbgA (DUF1722 family)/uncharacterized protein YbbK (DUF523 family)